MQAYHPILWATLLLLSQAARGQSFAYRAALPPVPADSFYRIPLSPAITGHLQANFADIRLLDRQGREVPYLLMREAPAPARPGRYLPVPGVAFRQTDSLQLRKSILRFTAATPVLIDQLVFTITAPSLYHRQATLYQKQEPRGRRRRRHREYQAVQHFVLASNQDQVLLLPGFRSQDFYVEIQNGDSPPLVVAKAGAYQLATSLVAFLEKQESYQLAFGSQAERLPPTYDLSYFKDRIPRPTPVLQPGKLVLATEKPAKKEQPLNAFFSSRYLLWAALLAVIAFLGFMTYKLVKEAARRRPNP